MKRKLFAAVSRSENCGQTPGRQQLATVLVCLLSSVFCPLAGHAEIIADANIQRTLRLGTHATGTITPAQITADQNNYAPTGLATASVLRLSTDASRNVTGLTAGAAGEIKLLENVGSFDLVLVNASASSTAANRFAVAADLTLTPFSTVLLIYDATATRWRAIGGSGSGASGSFQPLDASLTAYAALTTAANKGIYYSGADTPVAYDLTSFGRTLGGLADYAALRTGAGLVIGTDVLGVPASSAEGDVLFRNATVWTRLPRGTTGQVLKSTASTIEWGTDAGGMTNPMTTAGDLIVGGASGAPTRKAIGTDGQVLKVVSGAVDWGTDSTGSGSLPGTPATGDVTYYNGTNWVSLAIGSAAQVLTVNGTADAPEWAAGGGGGDFQPLSSALTEFSVFNGGTLSADFTFATNGDSNGVIYFLGSAFGTSSFANPDGSITVTTRLSSQVGTNAQLTDRTLQQNNSQAVASQWIALDLGSGRSLVPTKYSLRQTDEGGFFLRNWKLQGTNTVASNSTGDLAAATWTDLDTHSSDTTINAAGAWGSFDVSGVSTGYRWLRILQTGLSSGSDNYLGLCEWEFYGTLNYVGATASTGDLAYYNGTSWARLGRGSNGRTLQSTASTIGWGAGVSTLYHSTTAVGNVGTGVDDLITQAIAANTLATNGDRLRITALVSLAANGNSKQILARYGATTCYDSTAQTANAGTLWIEVIVTRTGAATQNIAARVNSSNALFASTANFTTAAETLSGAVTFKLTGEGVATDDIIQRSLLIEFMPAP